MYRAISFRASGNATLKHASYYKFLATICGIISSYRSRNKNHLQK